MVKLCAITTGKIQLDTKYIFQWICTRPLAFVYVAFETINDQTVKSLLRPVCLCVSVFVFLVCVFLFLVVSLPFSLNFCFILFVPAYVHKCVCVSVCRKLFIVTVNTTTTHNQRHLRCLIAC